MSCPHYQDFTRNCLNEYPALVKYESFIKCETDDYPHCVFYSILRSGFRCKYLESCLKAFPDEIPQFMALISNYRSIYEFITEPVYNYCLSKENHMRCARYKIHDEGRQPPKGLNPNGMNVNITDSIENQKLVIEESSHTK